MRRERLAVASLLALFGALCISSVWRETLTSDEPFHFRYGMGILKLDSTRFDNSKMPLNALNALPCLIGEHCGGSFPDQGTGVGRLLCHRTTARTMTTLLASVLGLHVFLWARDLYGARAGLLSLFLFSLCPNLIAHSRLITSDLPLACTATVASYHFWRFLDGRGGRWTSAITLGLCQLSKYTAVFFVPVFLAVVLLARGGGLLRSWRERAWQDVARRIRSLAGHLLVYAAASVLVVNAGFLLNRSFTPLGGYQFRSGLFRSLQQRLATLEALPVPVPYPYLEGLDWVKDSEDRGSTNANLYMLGRLRDRHDPERAFIGYFVVGWLFKVPLATQALVLWSLARLARGFQWQRVRRAELHLLAPVIFLGIYFNFFFRTQIGFRFFLPALPYLFVLCGSLLAEAGGIGPRARRVAGGLLVGLALSVLSHFPHYLSYFNELVWDRKMSYRILADSNLEWGQDRGYLRDYVRAHPEVIVHPRRPVAGRIVVSVNRFVGVFREPQYRWLRESFEPVDRVAGSYLVFEITPAALERALSHRGLREGDPAVRNP